MLSVSVVFITFNQKKYVQGAMHSIFSQSHHPLEIVISDDGSTDGTYELLEELVSSYSGPHDVLLLPKTSNAGLIGNLNRALARATGELVIAAAGDDISHPDRAVKLAQVFMRHNKPMLIHTKARVIDANGTLTGREEPPERLRFAMSAEVASTELSIYLGATAAWSRGLLDAFDPISERDAFEDLVMGFRASLYDSVVYHDEALVDYRVGNGMSQQQPASMDAYVKRRKWMIKVNLAVYRQRLIDVRKTRRAPASFKPRLESLMATEEGRLAFYERMAAGVATASRLRFILGWLDECRKHLKNRLLFGLTSDS